jgi:hypothetical protein
LHVKQLRLARQSPRIEVRLTGALREPLNSFRRGCLPDVGPLTTADSVVLSARTIYVSFAPPVDLWCVSTTPAKRALGSSGQGTLPVVRPLRSGTGAGCHPPRLLPCACRTRAPAAPRLSSRARPDHCPDSSQLPVQRGLMAANHSRARPIVVPFLRSALYSASRYRLSVALLISRSVAPSHL